MSPPAKCCNPLKKKSHTNFREKLCLISNHWDSRFSALYGLHVCSKCKVQLYREKKNIQFVSPETEKNCANSENVSGNVTDIECGKKKDEESSSTENDADFRCKKVDEQHKRRKLVAHLRKFDFIVTL